jgi:hypothetical protein
MFGLPWPPRKQHAFARLKIIYLNKPNNRTPEKESTGLCGAATHHVFRLDPGVKLIGRYVP